MVLLDALSTENSLMVGAVEMLHSVDVLFTEFLRHAFLIFIVKIKVT
jgi:hypothetical protein